MISPSDFRKRWGEDDDAEPLVIFPAAILAGVSVPDVSTAFLTNAGLPESAAPFLNFQLPKTATLQSVSELWQRGSEFGCYRVIGSNGSDDPVCLDESRDGQIVYLNHDNDFQRVLINSTVPQLAESLLSYEHLVSETQSRNGEDAYLDGDVPDDLQQWLTDELHRIDAIALGANGFWTDELDNLRLNAT